MSKIVTAMFDSRSDAEMARERLSSIGVDAGSVSIVDQSTSGFSSSEYSTHQNKGFWATLKDAFLPDEDRHTYEEGVRRGHYLLTASVDDQYADEATRILDDANTIDIDERSSQWRQSGWQAPAAGAAAYGADRDMDRPLAATGDRTTGEAIPIVEENLVVGKREVNRGTVRVRSYVTEKPVTEQVNLREEHVDVERRPATYTDVPADAFRERTLEVTETAEEAVVSKQARVVEEVVVRKDVGSHTETVSDTVRRTDVEVDRGGTTDRSYAAGTTGAGYASDRPLVDTDSDGDGRGAGSETRGLANEAVGNIKQGLASVTGSESLERLGEAQERRGEAQQGKPQGY